MLLIVQFPLLSPTSVICPVSLDVIAGPTFPELSAVGVRVRVTVTDMVAVEPLTLGNPSGAQSVTGPSVLSCLWLSAVNWLWGYCCCRLEDKYEKAVV